MKKADFRDRVLGRWSSHPDAVAWRTRRAAFLASIPVVLFAIALLARIRNPANWLAMLRDAQWWIGAGVILASFTVAILLTLALMARLNRWNSHQKHQRLPTLGWFDPWMILPAAAVAFAGPYWLATVGGVGPVGMWIFRFLAFLPLMTLIAITGSSVPSDNVDAEPKRQGWLLAVAAFCLLGAGLTLTHDLARVSGNGELASSVERFLPWYQDHARPFSGFLGFGSVGLVAFALWRLWYRRPTELERTVEHHGSFKRIFGLTRDLVDDPDETENSRTDLHESAASSVDKRIEAALFGFDPSVEQLARMSEIRQRYEEALNENDPAKAARLIDIQIPGSGSHARTATLVASALRNYLSYGRRSIWILPSSASTADHQEIVAHFHARLDDLNLDWLVTVSPLTFQLALDWGDEQAELPAILVTTPQSLSERILDNTALKEQDTYTFVGSYPHLYFDEPIDPSKHASITRMRASLEKEGIMSQWISSPR